MRKIILDGADFVLDDDCVWQGPEPMAGVLNKRADKRLKGTGPQDGEPVLIVFHDAIEKFKPSAVVDDTPPMTTEPGVVY